MKLASLPRLRDGRLIVVSSDLAWYADADRIVPNLQAALDDWEHYRGALETLATELEHEAIPQKRFHEREAAAPLPRAGEWVSFADGKLYRGAPGDLRGGRSPIELADEDWGCGFEPQVVVVTADVPQGASRSQALAAIRLVGLANPLVLRHFPTSFTGVTQPRPTTAFSPVFVTPDALGELWSEGRLRSELLVEHNGVRLLGDGGEGPDFGEMIAEFARTRRIGAGAIFGSTPFAGASALTLRDGDRVRVEVRNARGRTIFGAIEQDVRLTPDGV